MQNDNQWMQPLKWQRSLELFDTEGITLSTSYMHSLPCRDLSWVGGLIFYIFNFLKQYFSHVHFFSNVTHIFT